MQPHHRRSIRLPAYDYTQPGYYFITLATHHGYNWFGEIDSGATMHLNAMGKMVEFEWRRLTQRFPCIALDNYGIMPNYFHGIIQIVNERSWPEIKLSTQEAFARPVKQSIPTMVRSFKAAVTLRARRMTGDNDLKLWQFNYFERVIRNERGLLAARLYILSNPSNWALDRENNPR